MKLPLPATTLASSLCALAGGCAHNSTKVVHATEPAPMSAEAEAWAPLAPFAAMMSAMAGVTEGPSTFRVVKRGEGRRIFPTPPKVRSSVGPWATEIPLTIADDASAGKRSVLTAGQSAHAATPNGEVTIDFIAADRRRITWRDDLNDGDGTIYSQEVRLHPRGVWYGVAGQYSRDPFPPGDRILFFGEGEMRAKSLEDAMKILRVAPSMCWTMSSTGLIVGYWPGTSDVTTSVDLIQLYINDVIPTGLEPLRGGKVQIVLHTTP